MAFADLVPNGYTIFCAQFCSITETNFKINTNSRHRETVLSMERSADLHLPSMATRRRKGDGLPLYSHQPSLSLPEESEGLSLKF